MTSPVHRSGGSTPVGYGELLSHVKAEVSAARLRAAQAVNSELIALYWRIGKLILREQREQGWGAGVISQLAQDLQVAFPQTSSGLSAPNLQHMRAFAAAWPDGPISTQAVWKLPWGHVRTLLGRVKDAQARDWYAAADTDNGWSRAVLEHHIATDLRARQGLAPSNFADHLPPAESDLATSLVKDPYVFDFLGLTAQASERDLEQAMIDRLRDTLIELGNGMAFIGRQVRFDVDGDEFVIDLLLFHPAQVRYVVVELKIGKFKPEYAGQLGFYVALIDDRLRDASMHASTVGILICGDRNEQVVRYALRAAAAPMAVSTYTYETLPPKERAALPAAATMQAVFTAAAAMKVDVEDVAEGRVDGAQGEGPPG